MNKLDRVKTHAKLGAIPVARVLKRRTGFLLQTQLEDRTNVGGGGSHESNQGSPDDACAHAGRVDAAHRTEILASCARSDSGSPCQAELDPPLEIRGVHGNVAAAEGSATPKTPLTAASTRGGLYTSRLASSPAGLEPLDRRAVHPAPRVPSAVAASAPVRG